MKKVFTMIAASCVFFSFSVISCSAQDNAKSGEAEAILQKMITAMGGKERLANIADTTMTGSIKLIPMNMDGSLTTYEKGDKLRADIKIMGMNIKQAHNGKIAWMINPTSGSATELPAAAAEIFKASWIGNEAYIHPEKYGITYSYDGRKIIDDKEYILLKQSFKGDVANTLYLDPKTYLMAKLVGPTLDQSLQRVEAEATMSDYRDAQGTKVPFSISIKQAGTDFMKISIIEYKYNSDIQDSFFDKP
jgi:zinc protease